MRISLVQILKTAVRELASDIHITPGTAPGLRVNGEIIRLNVDPLTVQQSKELCYSIITDEQKAHFESHKDLDFSFGIEKYGRFRGHLYHQKQTVAGSFRHIPTHIPKLSDIGLPPVLHELSKKPYGLILITGPTGSGKSTTLASIINEINKTRKCHIITIEDPIEFVYPHEKAIVNQREVGLDVESFAMSLKAALRMDPDVCLLGEMRDRETIENALQIAETGHLAFGTLHTNSACSAIERLTGVFSGEERKLVQYQLSSVLQGIMCQSLLPTADGKGRVPAVEVLLFPPSVRNLIREGKQNQIYSIMQTQRTSGFITMNQSLFELLKSGLITEDAAFNVSGDHAELDEMLTRKKGGRKTA